MKRTIKVEKAGKKVIPNLKRVTKTAVRDVKKTYPR